MAKRKKGEDEQEVSSLAVYKTGVPPTTESDNFIGEDGERVIVEFFLNDSCYPESVSFPDDAVARNHYEVLARKKFVTIAPAGTNLPFNPMMATYSEAGIRKFIASCNNLVVLEALAKANRYNNLQNEMRFRISEVKMELSREEGSEDGDTSGSN